MRECILDVTETVSVTMGETIDALVLIAEEMWSESKPDSEEEKTDVIKAIVFTERYPAFYSTLQVILRDMRNQQKMLSDAVGGHHKKKCWNK